MMDNDSFRSQNPFDRFLKSSSLDMLEAALPYIGPVGRKPLALYMKFQEIGRIFHDFDDSSVLCACGFEERPADPEAMLRAMKLASGPKPTPQIDQILNMLQMLKTCQSISDMLKKNPEMASLLSNLSGQSSPPINLQDFHRLTAPKESDTNQLMSFLAEIFRSSDFSH